MIRRNNALIVFVKNLDADEVKTRIAAEKGEQHAKDVYNELLEECKNLCASLSDVDIKVYFSKHTEDKSWPYDKKLQQGNDLGSKMSNAFDSILAEYEKAVIIGSDCPYIHKTHIQEAFDNLNKTDVVIGPCTDGGYYLLGLKKLFPEIFEDVSWSTNRVFFETVEKALLHRKSISTLEYLEDIDLYEDYINWKKTIQIST